MENSHYISRRNCLSQMGTGFGMLALADMLAAESRAATAASATSSGEPNRAAHPYAVRKPHHAPRAKRVIFLYMPGGPSHIDLFDPKPRLLKDNGKPLPFDKPKLEHTKTGDLLGSPWKFSKHGEAGIDISELLPHTAKCADELCVIRSMHADNINHTGAAAQMCTGEQAFSRPAVGSWVTYGLGTENQNLPGFIVMSPTPVFQGGQLYASSFLPSSYQGTLVRDLKNPIANLGSAAASHTRQRAKLDALRQLNEMHKHARVNDSPLDARIAAFELAYRMQLQAPEAFDLSQESLPTQALYGINDPVTDLFGRQCLLARRLVERGVRFIQLFDAPENNTWDHHGDLRKKLPKNCAAVDRPIAALLTDLRARGLLDDTLVVWGGEFGRSPTAQGIDGREHHPFGFTMWLAGGGVRGGMIHGATDEFGWYAIQDKVHIHDLHATILHLLGLDHTRLTYRYGGRDYRLTDVHGNVAHKILKG